MRGVGCRLSAKFLGRSARNLVERLRATPRLPPPAHFLHGDISGKRTTRTLRELTGEEPKKSKVLEYIHDITFSLFHFFLFFFTIFLFLWELVAGLR